MLTLQLMMYNVENEIRVYIDSCKNQDKKRQSDKNCHHFHRNILCCLRDCDQSLEQDAHEKAHAYYACLKRRLMGSDGQAC